MKYGKKVLNGEKFRKCRKLLKLRAQDVARIMSEEFGMGLAHQTVYGWETGNNPQKKWRKPARQFLKGMEDKLRARGVRVPNGPLKVSKKKEGKEKQVPFEWRGTLKHPVIMEIRNNGAILSVFNKSFVYTSKDAVLKEIEGLLDSNGKSSLFTEEVVY